MRAILEEANMNLQGLGPLAGLALSRDQQEPPDFQLVQKTQGPRRLLMDILRQDPQMAEMLKKLRMKGGYDATSMESDYDQQGQ
jgi:hypothetical protein